MFTILPQEWTCAWWSVQWSPWPARLLSTWWVEAPWIECYLNYQGSIKLRYPFIVFTALGVVGILTTILVPETKDVPLPERLEDVDEMVKNFRIFEFKPRRRDQEKTREEEEMGLKRQEWVPGMTSAVASSMIESILNSLFLTEILSWSLSHIVLLCRERVIEIFSTSEN